MTPKEKAKELIYKFFKELPQWVNIQDAKQCALIAVNEIQKNAHNNYADKYWEQVKQEIELL